MKAFPALSLSAFLIAVASPSPSEEVTDKERFSPETRLIVGLSQQQQVTDKDRFDLWTGCSYLRLVVDFSIDHLLTGFQLYPGHIDEMVQRRLSDASIYGAEEATYLYVNVDATSAPASLDAGMAAAMPHHKLNLYRIDFHLKRLLHNHVTDQSDFATTWSSASHGMGDAEAILSDISTLTDQFIDEYLLVNAEDCGFLLLPFDY